MGNETFYWDGLIKIQITWLIGQLDVLDVLIGHLDVLTEITIVNFLRT